MKNNSGLLVLGLGAAAIYLATRKPEDDDGGGGGNGGPVTAQGSIGSVAVANQGTASMSAARVDKRPGEQITLTISLSGVQAVNGQGQVVTWPYRVIRYIGHNTLGPLAAWRTGDELGFPQFATSITNINTPAGVPNWNFTASVFYTTPDDIGVEWDVHLQLQAADSDSFGNPVPNQWHNIGNEAELNGAINIIAGATQTQGQVFQISVNQDPATLHLAGRPRYYGRRYG